VTDTIPDFETLAGTARVEQSEATGPATTLDGSLAYVADMQITGEGPCSGLWLKTQNESIVAVALNANGQAFICPGGPGSCQDQAPAPATIDGNVIQRRSDISNNRYRVEFLDDRVVYRIQEKKCLIPYPHGCLVYGRGWKDSYVYNFYKN